ncbi:MAG: LuxR C-terminal-related transcriptional regulator, partial [Pseudonocardia sp.]
DTLVAAALVVVGESPRVFRFRHPLVRRTVRGHTAPGWSARAHGRIAAALAAAGARPEARAPHVAQAAGLGDRDAARLLVTAADAVVARSPATAARWLADALRLLPGAGAALRHDLLGRRAHALTDAGRLDDAVATLREILALGAADRTAVVAACARTEYLRGRPVAALELLDAEPSAGARERAVLATERAAITLPADPVRAAEHAAEAVAAARYIGGRALRTRALALQALALVLAGDPRGVAIAGEAAGEVADSGVAGTEPVPVGRAVWTAAADPADTLRWLGEALTLLGRPSGIDHLRRGLDLAATGPAAVSLRTALGFALARQGRLPRARLQLDDAVDHARLAGSDELLAQALTVRCHVRTWTGDLPGALADGRRAVDLSAHRRDGVGAAAAMFLADALLQAGDPAAAVDTILDGAGGPELALLAPALRADGAAVLAEAALATGRVALARAAAGEAGPGTAAGEAGAAGGAGPGAPGAAGGARPGAPGAAARGAAPAVPSPVLRARALLAVHDGRTDARELAAGARTPLERLRARLVGADRAELLAVAEAADELGATTIAAAARAGAAGRALTDRERAVAELIAAGHSNRRIGAELYLAERTVERYVSAVLAKLGAPNRAAVGGLLRGGRSAAPG